MFIGAIGRPELADDPRFATVAGRLEHLDELQRYIADYAAETADAEALEAQCSKFKLAVGAVRSVAEVCDSDWARRTQCRRRASTTVAAGPIGSPTPPGSSAMPQTSASTARPATAAKTMP